ncbi:MAG: CRISPR-associated endonuclease Cas3'', partial [Gemmatimonadota bacterium]|nr:CRISPR-associated endonuclease Cas3'' [Gemmatimonadota bacterium]
MKGKHITASDVDVAAVPRDPFWAKLGKGDASYHPLLAHSADVAAVFRALLEPPGVFAARLAGAGGVRELRSSDRAALVYLVSLHDLGKANHGFQEMRYPRTQRRHWAAYDHLDAVYGSLGNSTPLRRLLGELASVLHPDPEIAADLMLATIYHHGRPGPLRTDRAMTEPKRLWEPDAQTGRDPLAHIRRLASCARRWSGLDELPNGPEPLLNTPAFTHLYAGLLTLSDWIGSNEQIFKFAREADDEPDRYWTERAVPLAREVCARIGLVPRTQAVSLVGLPLLEALFPATFRRAGHPPTGHPPTGLQTRVATLPLPGPGARLLVESETGSGKTEAALALYARLRAENAVAGLMFALPTRATASAMYDRVLAALRGLYLAGEDPTIALAIGGEGPRTEADAAVEQNLQADPQRWDEEIGPELRGLRNWASERSKTFLAAEIVVGTLDQALLATLRVKHAHLRLAPLSRHLLVVDELHSYDRYMATVLARLLALHTQAGGIALFMSATLSDTERRRFSGATEPEPTLAEAIKRPYPLLSICGTPNAPWREIPIPASNPAGQVTIKRVRWQCEADEAAALGQAIRAARAG